jgi:hypothetical protein
MSLSQVKRREPDESVLLIAASDYEQLAVGRPQNAPPEPVPRPPQEKNSLIAIFQQLVPFVAKVFERAVASRD